MLLAAIVVIVLVYAAFRCYSYITELLRMKTMANMIPGALSDDGFLGAAKDWAGMDSAQILDWELQKADELRERGHNYLRINFAHEVFVVPLCGEAIKPILESKEEITKGLGYQYITEWLGLGLLIATGQKWQTRRRLITPTFHFRHLETYVKTFNHHAKIFVDVLADLKSQEFDALPYISRCGLDIICDTAMGATVDVQHNPSHPFCLAVRNMLWLNTEYALKAQNWFYPYYWWTGKAQLYKDSLNVLHTFTRKVIAERKEKRAHGEKTTGKETNFLDMLFESYDDGQIDDEGLREEVDTFMFEGHDTTSTGVSWAVWCLAHHQDVQQKLYDEIIDVLGYDDDEVTTEQLKQMTYLDQVVKETFRLYAPVPQVNRRMQADFQLGEYTVPKGAIVTIAPIILARNKKVWGDDVLSFDPERFSETRESKYHPFDYIPFSAGPRNCIGQRFALLEAKVLICHTVRAFSLSSTRPFESLRTGSEAVLKSMDGIPVIATRRSHWETFVSA
ncbi:unnamed protein product, partial [Mesorhabditis spiculigera]